MINNNLNEQKEKLVLYFAQKENIKQYLLKISLLRI